MASPRTVTRCRVLIVEDEYFQASDLQRALTSLGADVMTLVGSVGDAHAQIVRGGFDLGIVDIDLRGDKAFGLADELQRQGVPFIFATGCSPELIPPKFADVTRWEKPFDPHLLARYVLQLWHRGFRVQ
jgi:DNA-binding NtrC family response regulator